MVGMVPRGRGDVNGMELFEIILHPKEKMAAELKKVNMDWAHKQFALYGAIIGLVLGIGVALLGGILGAVLGNAMQSNIIFGLVAGLGLLAIIIMPIIGALVTVVGSFIGYGIMYFVAKLLGGTGTFDANYFLGAKLLVPLIVANIIVGLLGIVPLIGALVNLIWFFYSVYLTVVLVSTANKLNMLKSLIVVILPIILIVILGGLIAGAIIASVLAGAAN